MLENGKSTLVERLRIATQKLGGSDEKLIKELEVDEPVKPIELATIAEAAKCVGEIKFLLKEWIPYGLVSGIIAEPGMGKSAFALCGLVKPVTTGCSWFNGRRGPKPGKVIWWPTENDLAITSRRVTLWGIPGNRLIIASPKQDPTQAMLLTSEEHLANVEYAIKREGVRLVVIDSLRGGHNTDENSSKVYEVLQGLAKIAERTGTAVIVIHHTKKLVQDEVVTANSSRGSNAIIAMMRSQLAIDRPDRGSKWRRLRVLKENLGIAPKSVGFLITDNGLEFGPPPIEKSRQKTERVTERSLVEGWLRRRLKPGVWYKAATIIEEAGLQGFSANAVQRAREGIGITIPSGNLHRLPGAAGAWEWRLPK